MRRLGALLLLLGLPGCLVTGTLDPAGGAHLTVRGRLLNMAQFDSMQPRSDTVTLVSSTIDLDRWATYEFQVADVERLSSIGLFASTRIAFTSPDEHTRRLEAVWVNPRRLKMTPASRAYFGSEVKVELTMPGPVRQSNATATSGRMLTWAWPVDELTLAPQKTLEAVFAVPGA